MGIVEEAELQDKLTEELKQDLGILLEGFRHQGLYSWSELGVLIAYTADAYNRSTIEYQLGKRDG